MKRKFSNEFYIAHPDAHPIKTWISLARIPIEIQPAAMYTVGGTGLDQYRSDPLWSQADESMHAAMSIVGRAMQAGDRTAPDQLSNPAPELVAVALDALWSQYQKDWTN